MDLSLKEYMIKIESMEKRNANKEKTNRVLRGEEDQRPEGSESGISSRSCSESLSTQLFGPNDSTLLRILGER